MNKIMHFADGPKEIRVGMQVVVTNGQSGRNFNKWASQVIKVGNKMVTLACRTQVYFDGNQKTQSVSGKIYSSEAEYERMRIESRLIDKVRIYLSSYSFKPTYEQALKLVEVLGIDLDRV